MNILVFNGSPKKEDSDTLKSTIPATASCFLFFVQSS